MTARDFCPTGSVPDCERPIEQPGRWVVTVVNNRYDRVARSKAFAEIIVRDASAERHILIGTNLAGLRVYIDQALTHLLQELRLFRSDDLPAARNARAPARPLRAAAPPPAYRARADCRVS